MIMIIQKLSMLLKTKRIKEQLHCEKSVWRFDMRILAHFSMILPASKLKISAEKCDISKEKKTLQYHYISDKSEHAFSFEQKESELQNLSKFNRLTPKI
eukprot:UN21537